MHKRHVIMIQNQICHIRAWNAMNNEEKKILQTTHIHKIKHVTFPNHKENILYRQFIHYAQKHFLITFVIVVEYCNTILSEHTEVQIKINQIANKLFLLISFFLSSFLFNFSYILSIAPQHSCSSSSTKKWTRREK